MIAFAVFHSNLSHPFFPDMVDRTNRNDEKSTVSKYTPNGYLNA
jgi:hypothetical protein